jgi:hypothetical protein
VFILRHLSQIRAALPEVTMKSRFLFLILSLVLCASALAKDIEGVDVVVKQRGGKVVATQHAGAGGAFSIPALPPGSYTVTITFTDPVFVAPAGKGLDRKNYFESRSNIARLAPTPAQSPMGGLQSLSFDAYPYVYSVGGSNIIVEKGGDAAQITQRGNKIEIIQQIEITGKAAQAVRGSIMRSAPTGPAAAPVSRPVG